ncbi:STAS domain-containing protein [Celeribacter indicus]|uniref:STAS domain-containing protein n=1 Tax=Celeribacter indicus TaxID=1208324 RepID=A0A0B5E1I9_9RHOB|nr:STAS domain-containing protein [Celeribacter indicus]AJE46901.1 hypothetical protein P73_2186 [Celeribacter indicus]SDW79107.1 chemotaxis protein CheX [Celeribacter indicus]
MTRHVPLHDRLDHRSAPALLEALRAGAGDDLVLDAADVRHLGALPLQILLSAAKTRAASGRSTRLVNASDACLEMLDLFGFTPDTLTRPETWT